MMIICAIAAVLSVGSCQNEEEYLVRETDVIRFDTPREVNRKITLRCVGAWKTVVPQGAEWVSTTPSEGVGDGSMEFIYVNAATNRGAERSATIYLENGGKQYPIDVYQADGAIVWGELNVTGSLLEGVEGEVVLTLPYSNTIGDETVEVTCVTDDSSLSASPLQTTLSPDSGKIVITVSGTPSSGGNKTLSIYVDGNQVASTIVYVYASDEAVLEGLPVQWEFTDGQGSTADVENLKKAKPEWTESEHYVKSDDQNGAATITIVEAAGKTASPVNGWGYNNGHIYVKGLYLDDYWLLTIPVKNLPQSKKIKVDGSINGSGSSPAFFLVEYSVDGSSWTVCDDSKATDTNELYHVQSYDALSDTTKGDFSTTFLVPSRISEGNLYIRVRVSVNLRVTLGSTITTTGGGSTRLKGLWKVSVVEN